MDNVVVACGRRRNRCHRRHARANGPSTANVNLTRGTFSRAVRRPSCSWRRRRRRVERHCGIVRVLREFRRGLPHFQVCYGPIFRWDTGRGYRRRCGRKRHVNCRLATRANVRHLVASVVGRMRISRRTNGRRRHGSWGRVPQIDGHVRPVPSIAPVTSSQRRFVNGISFTRRGIKSIRRNDSDHSRR